MKKLFVMMMALMLSLTSFAVEIDTPADSTINLSEVTVSGLYRNTVNVGYLIPEYLTFNAYGSYRYKQAEFGARVNNIFNRTNYFNAAMGATELLWFRNGGTNFFVDVKYYF